MRNAVVYSILLSALLMPVQSQAADIDKHVKEQTKAINSLPGEKIEEADLSEKKVKEKSKVSLNPVSWLFKPVTQLQSQTIRLEQQIVKLNAPIAALQPSMIDLSTKMKSVHGTMGEVNGSMRGVQQQMGNVSGQMDGVRGQLKSMSSDISAMRSELVDLRAPLVNIKEPLVNVAKPLSDVDKRLTNLDKQIGDLKGLLALVLTSIFVAAALVAIGTPIAAIVVWQNRARLFPRAENLPGATGNFSRSESELVRR